MNILKKFKAGETYILPLSEVAEFSLHPCNREIKERIVKALMKEVEDDPGLAIASPIKVGIHTGNILDGQHRREAYMRLVKKGRIPSDIRIGAHFVDVAPEGELKKIQKYNLNAFKWNVGDYVQSEVKDCNPTFMVFDELIRRVPGLYEGRGKTRYRIATAAICGVPHNTNAMMAGKFVANECDLPKAVTVSEEVKWILNETMSKPSALAEMMALWYKMRDSYPFREWQAAIKKRKKDIMSRPRDTKVQWKIILDDLYTRIGTAMHKKIA